MKVLRWVIGSFAICSTVCFSDNAFQKTWMQLVEATEEASQ